MGQHMKIPVLLTKTTVCALGNFLDKDAVLAKLLLDFRIVILKEIKATNY